MGEGGRGTDGRIYPWGNQWDATRCNSRENGLDKTTSVYAYPQGASPYGVLDMVGNVWEWTRSRWGKYPYPRDAKERAQREDLQAPHDPARVLRGSAFDSRRGYVRCASRDRSLPDYWNSDVGFRVVMHP